MSTTNTALALASDSLAQATDTIGPAVIESSGVVSDAVEHVAEVALDTALPVGSSLAKYLWARNRRVTGVIAGVIIAVAAYRWWSARQERTSKSSN